jgi:hypothetical protein
LHALLYIFNFMRNFLYEADCEFRIAMSPEDLGKAGLDELGKKWS